MSILYNMVDVKNQMYIRDNPLITFSDEQYEYILSTMLSIEARIKQEASSAIDTSRIIVFTELIKSQMRTLFYEIINIYLINQPLDIKAPDRNDEVMQRFIVSLDMHYRKERNVAFYASEQCLSYSYFSEIIKAKSGVTALKWIINRVIMDAEQMLEYTNVSVKEIAARLSFPTQSFFGKYFKQYVGISPKEYRKKARSRKGEIPNKNIEVDFL
ncbi:MAG TPA: AraC family transcriptional regulator [Xylanibacter oryzae]|nr:AraC family transcriptional regulator [Xylanibacter oryzae]